VPAPVQEAPPPATHRPGAVTSSMPRKIGVVSHYYGHAGAAIIEMLEGELRVGDTLHFRGHTTDFYQRIERIEVEHRPVEVARTGDQVGVQISRTAREHDEVFLLTR
jgi:translation elongation factor EF-1alpha